MLSHWRVDVDTPMHYIPSSRAGVRDLNEDTDGWALLCGLCRRTLGSGRCPSFSRRGWVDIDQRDRGGKTALVWVVSYGHASVVAMAMLSEKHANHEAGSSNGQISVSATKSYGRRTS